MNKKNKPIFGMHAIKEMILSGESSISKLWIKNTAKSNAAKDLLHLAKKYNIPCSKVPLVKLNRLTKANHQGAIAFLSPIPLMDLDYIIQTTYEKGKDPLVVLLDNVQDTMNLGAIARTALATQVDALIIGTKYSAPITAEALKASAGALAHVPVCRTNNFASTIQFLKESGLEVIACTEKAKQTLYREKFSGPIALLVGGEGRGITHEHLEMATRQIKIPMHGAIASLNVSVATAVVLYEIVRQGQTAH